MQRAVSVSARAWKLRRGCRRPSRGVPASAPADAAPAAFAVAAVAVTRPVQVFGVLIRFLVYIFTTVVLRTGLRSGLLVADAAVVTNSLLAVLPAALVPVVLCHNDYFRKQLP